MLINMTGGETKVTPKKTYPTLSGLGEERVWKPSPLRRVDIVAMGVSAIEYAQSNYHAEPRKPDHQVWTVNSGVSVWMHDLCWNMHDLVELNKREPHCEYFKHYAQMEKPLVTIRALKELPTSLEFPFAEFVDRFEGNYFANTVSYMIAGAIMCGVKEIGVYGADYNYPDRSDYEAGRASVEYWLGYAAALGITNFVPRTGTLLDACHRVKGAHGAIGYGEVYGYFAAQPQFDMVNGKVQVVGFDASEITIDEQPLEYKPDESDLS